MTPIHLRPSTLDEIVFEGRNKAYGAFDLRQTYPTHVRRALGTALLLFAVLAAAPGIARLFKKPEVLVGPKEPIIELTDPGTIFKPIPPAEPVAPAPAASIKAPRTVALPTKVVADNQARIQPPTPEVIPPDALFGSTTNLDATGPTTNDGQIGTGTSDTPTTNVSTAPPAPATTEVFITAERMPKFAGGDAAMVEFLRRNMRYPAMALRNQVEGKVFVSFTVSATGEIVDVQILKGLGSGTDEEALRVVKKMPAWEPGAQNGHPVAVRYTLPITFHIGN